MTRTESIRALLGSLYDYLPGPKVQHFGALPGPAPTTSAPCRACGGQGHFGKRRRPCAACNATGTVVVDGYTGEPVGSAKTRIRCSDTRRIEAELRHLAANAEIRRGRMLDDPFAWEAERVRYRAAGSYRDLERALERMREHLPRMHSLVMSRLVYRIVEPTPRDQGYLDVALRWLEASMPGEIRVPRWVIGEPAPDHPGKGRWANGHAQAMRDERIRGLAAEGLTHARIAAIVGVSRGRVTQILGAVTTSGTVGMVSD